MKTSLSRVAADDREPPALTPRLVVCYTSPVPNHGSRERAVRLVGPTVLALVVSVATALVVVPIVALFSTFEPGRFAMEASVVKRMKVPTIEIARVDPLLVLPPRPARSPKAAPSPSS